MDIEPLQKGSLAFRYLYEDRWGGELDWTLQTVGEMKFMEKVFTPNALRLLVRKTYQIDGKYNILIPITIKIPFMAIWLFKPKNVSLLFKEYGERKIGKHQWLGGLSTRYSWYDDNTTATEILTANNPNFYMLPGIFLEDEIILKERHKLLLGMRLDQHRDHGVIATPRAGYKINFDEQTLLRLNAGTGFRVVNIFTEDHAALTGARDLVIEEDLAPEQSYNINLNFYKKSYTKGMDIRIRSCAVAYLFYKSNPSRF